MPFKTPKAIVEAATTAGCSKAGLTIPSSWCCRFWLARLLLGGFLLLRGQRQPCYQR